MNPLTPTSEQLAAREQHEADCADVAAANIKALNQNRAGEDKESRRAAVVALLTDHGIELEPDDIDRLATFDTEQAAQEVTRLAATAGVTS